MHKKWPDIGVRGSDLDESGPEWCRSKSVKIIANRLILCDFAIFAKIAQSLLIGLTNFGVNRTVIDITLD